VFGERSLDDWLALFGGEDVAVGPVATFAEASARFAMDLSSDPPPPRLGEHTAQWRSGLGLS
jgi:crotonobetainyl-CoA:carnitine CoA-transferase CaiB-like acyl-CoA transferase